MSASALPRSHPELPLQPYEHGNGLVPHQTALEVDFPSVEVSRIAEHESWRKEVHRPATHTHKWWAQRLGSVFRGILAAATTTGRNEAIAAFTGHMSLSGLVVYDPFAGSGTTLIEAAKAGAGVIGRDINPVAVLVQRQGLQSWDQGELDRLFKTVETKCRVEIDRLHVDSHGRTVLYYFWVAVADCPDCTSPIRLFSRHVYAQHAYPRKFPKAQVVCPACLALYEDRYDFDFIRCSCGHVISQAGAVAASRVKCRNGHEAKVIDALAGKPPRHEMYAKLILNVDGSKSYEAADDFDRTLYVEAERLLAAKGSELVQPVGQLDDGYNTRQALRWGYSSWRNFFNARQLYCLGLLATAVRDLEGSCSEREALATLFSGTLEFNNVFCSFKGEGTGAVRHMFSHHVLKPERTPLEAHPWGTPASSGSFSTLYRSRLLRALEYKTRPFDQVIDGSSTKRVFGLSHPVSREIHDTWPEKALRSDGAYVCIGDAANTDIPDGAVDLVITDPPYMDNVHYSELADFFHAWLSQIKPFPGYSSTNSTRSSAEVQSTSAAEFEGVIAGVWQECRRVLKADGLLAFTFHQARASGWCALVRSLKTAGFHITAVQPVKAEMSTSITKGGAAEPSNLDSIVVCRAQSAIPYATTVEAAEERARKLLADLRVGGVKVGPGDVRSVVRGSVLSLHTNGDDRPIADLAAVADDAAERVLVEIVESEQ